MVRTVAIASLLMISVLASTPRATGQATGQQAYLKSSNNQLNDEFGTSLSVSGSTMVVGAVKEDSLATGVNGDQGNNTLLSSGAAYVFVRTGTSWSQQAYLKASNTAGIDQFGSSVSVSGNTIVVGAIGEDSGSTGVNGEQFNNTEMQSGAVYVFVRNGTTWSQQAYLKASNTEAGDEFGNSVSISGDTLVVGAHLETSSATGVDGDQADNATSGAGAAYVFVRTGTHWSQQAYLKASNTGAFDFFGDAVSVSGDTIVVAAPREDSSATEVNGDQSDNGAMNSGAAYVFVRSGTTWSQQAYLKASNAGMTDFFGSAVSVSGDTVVLGAVGEDSGADGVNGDQGNSDALQSGASYVFVRSGTSWSQQAYLKASSSEAGDAFGNSVSASGDTIAVGAHREDSSATGVDGDEGDNRANDAGAAYVFVRSGSSWSPQSYLKASNTELGDDFGNAAAVSGDVAVLAAVQEDSGATGVNGDQFDETGAGSGAAYAFDLDLDAWTDLDSGLAGVNGVPNLVGTGTLVAGSSTSLMLERARPSSPALLFASLSSTPVPFKGGTLVPVPVLVSVALATLPDGTLTLPFTWPSGVPSATSLWFQDAIGDPAAVHGVALSTAIRGTTP